jgi:hypothetical protein
MIALLQSPTDRLTAFAHAWRAALDLALGSTAAAAQGAQQQQQRMSSGWNEMYMVGIKDDS